MRPTDCELSLNQGTAFSSNTESDLIIAIEKKTTKTQRIYFWFRPAMQECARSLWCFHLFFICYALVLTFLTKLLETKNISFYY